MVWRLQIHWLSPTVTLIATIAGIAFAIAHYVFYQSLSGTAAPTDNYTVLGSSIPRQQANTAICTALAFLVKSSLVLAVSISYVHVFWRIAKARTSRRPMTLAILDKRFSALGNPFLLVDFRVWWTAPLLLLLAVTAWYQ